MFIETSAPRRAGDNAVLVSGAYTTRTTPQCLEFWYNMYGRDTGTLNVYFMSGSNKGSPVYTKQGMLIENNPI